MDSFLNTIFNIFVEITNAIESNNMVESVSGRKWGYVLIAAISPFSFKIIAKLSPKTKYVAITGIADTI